MSGEDQQDPNRLRVGFLVIGRKRPGFDVQWGQQIEAAVWAAAAEMDLEPFRPPTRVVDDASLRQAHA